LFPLGSCRFIQVIRGKHRLLKRKAQLVQQRTDVMWMIFNAKGAQEASPGSTPHSRHPVV
jgi:hypothetical protein